jgi:hypothetical protein
MLKYGFYTSLLPSACCVYSLIPSAVYIVLFYQVDDLFCFVYVPCPVFYFFSLGRRCSVGIF